MRLSGRPIFSARESVVLSSPSVEAIREEVRTLDSAYVLQQITRMETSVSEDPALAIGTAKELIETCCKMILEERQVDMDSGWDLSQLSG